MINTTFLLNEDVNFKEFSSSSVQNTVHKKLAPEVKFEIDKLVYSKPSFMAPNFKFTDGNVYLRPNTIFCVEYVNEHRDLVLPKDPTPGTWVSLWYEQHTVIFNLTNQEQRPIKIYNNGERIMGLDEPLICDLEFQTLKLIYIDEIQGWVIV